MRNEKKNIFFASKCNGHVHHLQKTPPNMNEGTNVQLTVSNKPPNVPPLFQMSQATLTK